ncbi:MAG: ABC transporter ATP-binding protein [bacterium]
MSSILRLKDIVKTYFLKNETIEVLKDVNLDVAQGRFIVIVGPSGSGKSTLLNIMGSLDRPTSGTVILDDVDISSRADVELSAMRNKKLGFVFQFHHLLGEFTCLENISLPGLLSGQRQKQVYKKAAELLEKFGMADKVDRLPEQLSGGEKQRVAIARALINDPRIILADEPAGNLDEGNTNKLIEVLLGLKDEGRTVILVTHSLDIAKAGSDVYNLKEGRLYGM